MNENTINWESIPDVITKDQLYRICHISKSTALYLLQSGKIPCAYTGKKTRCYKIKKEDVIAYLENRKIFPESYSAPAGWYKGNYTIKMKAEVPEVVLEYLRTYYTELLADYPDVLTTQVVSKITGYLNAVDQSLDECAGQRTVGLDLCGVLFQRPVLLNLRIYRSQAVL